MVAELTKRLDNSTNQSRKDKDQSKYQHQPNPSTKNDPLYESFLSLQSFKENRGIHIFYQPLTVYEGDSYNYGNGPSEIMMNGYETTCQKINDYRKRFTNNERVEDIPYIKKT